MAIAIYNGDTYHSRLTPVEHRFSYTVQGMVIDLDDLPDFSARSTLFKYNSFAPLSIYDCDYIVQDNRAILFKLRELIRDRGGDLKFTKVRLITTPRFFGYVFNPVSFYYCYDDSGECCYHVSEINNTYGERHIYVCGSDILGGEKFQDTVTYHFKKEFFVSPFNKVEGEYEVKFAEIKSNFFVGFNIKSGEETVFVSHLKGNLITLNKLSLLSMTLLHPIRLTFTMLRILYQAQILRFLRRIPMLDKPEPVSEHTQTIKEKR